MKKYNLKKWQGVSQYAITEMDTIVFTLIDTVVKEINANWKIVNTSLTTLQGENYTSESTTPLWLDTEAHADIPQFDKLIEEISQVVENPKNQFSKPIVLNMPSTLLSCRWDTRPIEITTINFYTHPEGLLIELSYDNYETKEYILCH